MLAPKLPAGILLECSSKSLDLSQGLVKNNRRRVTQVVASWLSAPHRDPDGICRLRIYQLSGQATSLAAKNEAVLPLIADLRVELLGFGADVVASFWRCVSQELV